MTSPIRIPDLGLILRLGEVRWADEKRVRKSICVEALISAGKIRVSYERRNKKPMSNPTPKPSIHAVTMSRPATRVLTVAGAPSAPSVDVEKLAAAVASAAPIVAAAAAVAPQRWGLCVAIHREPSMAACGPCGLVLVGYRGSLVHQGGSGERCLPCRAA